MGSVLYAGGIRTSTRQNAIVPLVLTIRSTLARMTDDLYIRCRDRTGSLLGADVPPHNETFCTDVPLHDERSAQMLPARCSADAVASVPRVIYPPG